MRTRIFRFIFGVGLIAGAVAFQPTSGTAQDVHNHTPAVSGVPQGVPFFCANPTVRSIGSGAWSDSKIWSTGKIPGTNDKVRIEAGHVVTFNAASDARLNCIEVNGALRFATDANTWLSVGSLLVVEDGNRELGTAVKPIAANATVEIVIAVHA